MIIWIEIQLTLAIFWKTFSISQHINCIWKVNELRLLFHRLCKLNKRFSRGSIGLPYLPVSINKEWLLVLNLKKSLFSRHTFRIVIVNNYSLKWRWIVKDILPSREAARWIFLTRHRHWGEIIVLVFAKTQKWNRK